MRRVPTLDPPGGAREVLLHSCCAPCSSALIECLLDHGIRPTVFYYNPNIQPRREYLIRKAENIRYAESLGLDFIDADYRPDNWLAQTRNLRDAPERGARCALCFRLRLAATAGHAASHGFRVFTTTLATSRWKDRAQIIAAGRAAADPFPELTYWEHDWRKGGLTERKNELTRTLGFYRQQYCGCTYSLRDTNRQRRERGLEPISLPEAQVAETRAAFEMKA